MDMRKGFTLIELLVVIAIIAVLAAVITPSAFKAIEKSKIAKTRADLKALKTAILSLYTDTGKFPNGCPAHRTANPEISLDNPRAGLISKPPVGVVDGLCQWTATDVAAWDGPYLEGGRVRDFWRNSYVFDPDYARKAYYGVCPDDAEVYAPPWTGPPWPPVLESFGPDGIGYTCDDIIVRMTLE